MYALLGIILGVFSVAAVAATSISLASFGSAILMLIVVALVFYGAWSFLDTLKLKETFDKIFRVLIGFIALIFAINILLGLVGRPMFVLG